MNRSQILEREERQALPVGICALAAAVLYIGGTIASQQGPVVTRTTSELLREFDDAKGTLLLGAGLKGIALLLLVPVLYYLFQAASARSPSVRRGLVGVVVAGPIFRAIAEVLQAIAIGNASSDFVAAEGGEGIPIGDYAEDLVRDQTIFNLAQGLILAGILALVFGVIYTALWSMRVGLLTRFFGTMGMALGAALLLLTPVYSFPALMLWFSWLGLVILGKAPRGRPPAWDAGEARPWPRPGDEAPEPDDEAEAEDDVEGDARELFEPEVNGDRENPNAARRERAKKRKRKRRR